MKRLTALISETEATSDRSACSLAEQLVQESRSQVEQLYQPDKSPPGVTECEVGAGIRWRGLPRMEGDDGKC